MCLTYKFSGRLQGTSPGHAFALSFKRHAIDSGWLALHTHLVCVVRSMHTRFPNIRGGRQAPLLLAQGCRVDTLPYLWLTCRGVSISIYISELGSSYDLAPYTPAAVCCGPLPECCTRYMGRQVLVSCSVPYPAGFAVTRGSEVRSAVADEAVRDGRPRGAAARERPPPRDASEKHDWGCLSWPGHRSQT